MLKKAAWLKIIKVFLVVISAMIIIAIVVIYRFFKPKEDTVIISAVTTQTSNPVIKTVHYKDKKIRVLQMQQQIDKTKPTILFIHGSPGSMLDFKTYLIDKDLQQKANLLTYERVGYGLKNTGKVFLDLNDEINVIDTIRKTWQLDRIILIGYSYGGTVAAVYPDKVLKKVLIAPSLKGEYEPKFLAYQITKHPLVKNLLPPRIEAAVDEKRMHIQYLDQWVYDWSHFKTPIVLIHGKKDKIVPYNNALFLKQNVPKDQLTLVSIEQGNHALIWNQFVLIKKEILKQL